MEAAAAMDSICQEIGINAQHLCETSVPGRFKLICDKQWLQTLEQRRKISTFTVHTRLDRRAHPDKPLEHPWTRVLVQTFRKRPAMKVYPLPRSTDDGAISEVNTFLYPNDGFMTPLSYCQAVAQVASTNFKNLWEAAYKQYSAAHVKFCKSSSMKQTGSPTYTLLPYDVMLKELIQRLFHCPVIHCKLDRIRESAGDEGIESTTAKDANSECHANILPALIAIETSMYFSVFFYPPAVVTSLHDSITYSPSILGKSYNKSLFLIYQILQLSKALQREGLFMGDVRLHDILVSENLWVQVIPRLEAIIPKQSNDDGVHLARSPSDGAVDMGITVDGDQSYGAAVTIDEDDAELSLSTKFDLKFAYDLEQFTLREYCEMWCSGQLSNYDYLTILNNAVGRSLSNPAYHHIMPWVTDFTGRNGSNWRDLSKSKYRLNKGDIHLDLMFSHAMNLNMNGNGRIQGLTTATPAHEAPHHVSDFLSEITYFVYMARRTPQHILREHVRPIWVPAEYPVSIQRLQEWTPDECIPEFYSDPMVFKSIHEDLPDLELPTWASCPEDFIAKHREALESQYVSERLHHWIDLNFGYKLSGKPAIKSKNVCLSLVDQHKNLCQRGIVQLFTQPHPPKRFSVPWFGRTAPKLSQLYNTPQLRSPRSEGNLSPFQANRLGTSTESLHNSSEGNLETLTRSGASPRMAGRTQQMNEELQGTSNFYQSTNFIELPKDYNPIALIQGLETQQSFLSRTFLKKNSVATAAVQEKMISSDLMFDENSEEHSFTNQLFTEGDVPTTTTTAAGKSKSKNMLAPCVNYLKRYTLKQILAEKRERELETIGCIIVELFAAQRLRPLLVNGGINATFEQRLHACRTITEQYKQDIPKCVRYVVRLLLQLQPNELVTERGLPPVTSAQLLEPIYTNLLIPFPSNYYPTYMLIRSLHAFDLNSTLLELNTHFNCNGRDCAKYTEVDRKRVLFERKIAECKVMSCCAHIGRLLEPVAYEQFPSIELLLPHITDLLTAEQTSILTAWNLFDSVAQALGIVNTQKYLLLPVLKLYDVECFERGMTSMRTNVALDAKNTAGQIRFSTSSSFKSRKSVKLYHHSFLLRLIVRFGLRCFLQNFTAPLVEAVGGYKEPEDATGFHYHGSVAGVASKSARRTSKNLSFMAGDEESSLTLLMSPDMLETELEDDTLSTDAPAADKLKPEMDGVFTFEEDGNSDVVSSSGTAENKSIDSFDIRATQAEEAKEEYTRAESTPERLAISEIIYGSKISNTSFEDTDRPAQTNVDSPTMCLGPKSPTITIPTTSFRQQTFHLNAIDCDIGSRKSVDSFEIVTQDAEDEQQKQMKLLHSNKNAKIDAQTAADSLQASVISKMSEAKAVQNDRISEMSAESLVWLSHRLGPVLTSRYITRNLLKMLSLCYVGQENLLPETSEQAVEADNLNYFSVADARVMGDRSAARVLECLMSIAALFGEEIVLLQYIPHISELIALSTKRVTSSLEGAIISTLQLLKYIVPCLTDATIMERLKDVILESILLPIINLLASTSISMTSGYLGRSVLARKVLDAIYVLCVRIGSDMSKENLCIPALRPFFLIFDKAYGISDNLKTTSISPPKDSTASTREIEELRDVFGPELAHKAYLSFLRFLGETIMQRSLLNLDFILMLCHEFEQPGYKPILNTINRIVASSDAVDCPTSSTKSSLSGECAANSFGTQVVGNRIEVVSNPPNEATQVKQEIGPMEVLDMVAYKFEQIPTTRHLKGNWLAYWRHEISRPEKDTGLSLKQIRLQSFVGHTNSVRAIVPLDNENSFISASKDKTVKLWSLRSEGDGRKSTACQYTYTFHKKSIHSLSFSDTMRFVVSCDSGVHIWDPFIGRPLSVLDSPKHNPVTVVKCLPSPSPLIVAGTAESSVKMLDARCMQYVNEWRVSSAPQSCSATVRCLGVAPSGNWIAVGLSSGGIVMLDTRMGLVLSAWRPTECDLLQLAAPNDHQLVSSALDHSLAIWHASDGILHYQLKPPAEPAHLFQTIDSQLVYATTGNRIGIYSDLSSSHAAYTVTKLRSETFRGVLTSLAVLPMNRAFLAGNESGNIVMLC